MNPIDRQAGSLTRKPMGELTGQWDFSWLTAERSTSWATSASCMLQMLLSITRLDVVFGFEVEEEELFSLSSPFLHRNTIRCPAFIFMPLAKRISVLLFSS